MPTIAVRDLAIQARESDLVVATFGRGFYVLDDLTAAPARDATEALEREAALAPGQDRLDVRPVRRRSACARRPSRARRSTPPPNPPFGAVFTYYLKDELKTKQKARQERGEEDAEEGGDVSYPPGTRCAPRTARRTAGRRS